MSYVDRAVPSIVKGLIQHAATEYGSPVKKLPRKLDKEQFGLCKVCHDKATGIHYGISSCEGCKGFYKRTMLYKRAYTCPRHNACEITVAKRKSCKACRFSKCIRAGMCLEGILSPKVATK